ncbi:hypothetical protein OG730_19880 [Streptomyces sp. NBC_01298]|uniref:hypothetical protein n=1 Tax=Streptomyces sp. NBC_01298 TaxID=2903817 RepID=UPI002E12FF1E|nr:hypothetical protein OG730_19880 [Streptomyces sp. NBC_01298]
MAGDSAGGADGQVGTRLNGIPPEPSGPGGGKPDFASTPAEKKAAAGTIENELEPDTKKAAEHADDSTGSAHKGFAGWETAAGLKTVADTWDQQVRALMGRLAAEKNALRGASGLFVRNDTGVGNQLLSQSKLNHL